MQRIWGFDVGTTSIGFAVIQFDESRQTGHIERMGVRIFPEGVTEKDREPRNKARRTARLLRRQYRRRRSRRKKLGDLLSEAGLLPPFDPAPNSEWSNLMSAGDPQKREGPYDLRARALSEKLEPHQLGRALYHLVRHRGFLSSRIIDENDTDKEQEEGKVKESIERLRSEMHDQTLGQHLAGQDKKRGRYIGREMVNDEFERLWSAQAKHHPTTLTDDLKLQFETVAFHQRPTFWRLGTLGNCWLEPGEPVCIKASWKAQRYAMLEKLNVLRFAGSNEPELDEHERTTILGLLDQSPKVSFGAIRKALKKYWQSRDLPAQRKFNLEVGGDEGLPGNATESELRRVFGDAWDSHPHRARIRSEIADRLFAVDYRRIGNKRIEIRRSADRENQRNAFAASVAADWGIDNATADALSRLKLPGGWTRHSEAAIDKLLPHLEDGISYGKLVNATEPEFADLRERLFPNRFRSNSSVSAERLPSHPRQMPDLRNPTVARALTEFRKVANNLLAAHGKPDLIRVELARDMTRSKRKRSEHQKIIRQREAERKKAIADLAANGISDPSGKVVDTWLLWKECRETCPYTGQKIGFDDLFRTGRFQVEHIFPRSRSLDNNFSNKTLCDVEENIRKGNRTPYEMYGADAVVWGRIVQSTKSIFWPHAEKKMRRFLATDFAEVGSDEFSERQLRDTAYIAVQARDFIARLGVPVETCNGQITRQLCRHWGLDAILNTDGENRKNRGDHRHHAIDALAVALTTRSFSKRLGDYFAREKLGQRPKLELPWADLWSDAKSTVGSIVVSHRVQRKTSGAMHAQTHYGDTGEDVVERDMTYRLFVTRKPLETITASQVESIRDPEIRRIVKDHIARAGGKLKEAFKTFPKLPNRKGGADREIRRVRVLVKRQEALMIPVNSRNKAYSDADTIHHIAIFVSGDNGNISFDVPKLARVKNAGIESKKRPLLTLSIGEAIKIPSENGQSEVYVVQKLGSNGQIFMRPHFDSSDAKPFSLMPRPLLSKNARKVRIDPIGRVSPAND